MTFDKDTNAVFSELVGSHLQESEGQDKCNVIDCGPFDNPRQAYLWIQSFTGSMSMLMRRDPNYQQIKKNLDNEFETTRTFVEENHIIHLAAVRCAAIVKFTFGIGVE